MHETILTANNLDQLVSLQDQLISDWQNQTFVPADDTFTAAVINNHHENFLLWYQEDKARRDDMGAEYVYKAKRAIDGHNQRRNNYMEQVDLALVDALKLDINANLPAHSETPGMMIDRLSILALKIYHMALQLQRDDVSAEHIATCEHKLAILKVQREDLKTCLQQLIIDIKDHKKMFKLYKQMKMYNDKTLNPQLYRQQNS